VGPGIDEGEVVSAVGEAALAADYLDVANREMVIATETFAEVIIRDATVLAPFLASFRVLVVPLFSSLLVFLPVLVLGQGRKCAREKK
jgi:hypothetical protein